MPWRGCIWWLLVVGAVALAAVGDRRFVNDPPLSAGAPWWLSALFLLGCCATLVADDGNSRRHGRCRSPADRLALLSVIGVAAVTRLWGVSAYPPPEFFAFEEFQTGGVAYEVLRQWSWPLEFPLTNILPALSFGLFGFSSYALRAPFVVNGILAPALLLLALRRFIKLPAAWSVAMLLAGSRWAATAARFADEIFLPISTMALGIWLLALVVQERRQIFAFGLAVVAASLCYAYAGYRHFPPLALIAVSGVALSHWRQGTLPRGVGRLFVLFSAVWAVLLSPGVVRSLYHNDPVLFEALARHAQGWHDAGSLEHSVKDRLAVALAHSYETWKQLFIGGDPDSKVNVPGDPMVDPVTGALVMLAAAVGLWRWRDPWRALATAATLVTFVAASAIPINLNVFRCFVLLVPALTLVAFLFDDLLRWHRLRAAYVRASLVALVTAATAVNLHSLHRLITDPGTREAFVFPENTVLAAIHRVPADTRVVLLTVTGSNAFEPSDYSWYTAHLTGGLAESLLSALTVDSTSDAPISWITEGSPEAELLPELVALICPELTSTIDRAADAAATVGVVSTRVPARCHGMPLVGLKATYTVAQSERENREFTQVDPAVMAYTIPAVLASQLETGEISRLHVSWSGFILAEKPGLHGIRLEVANASARLRLAEAEAAVRAPRGALQTETLQVEMTPRPMPLTIELDAQSGGRPLARLYWAPVAEPWRLVPASRLLPAQLLPQE